jgi:diguanylate cyclase (GGDEF)-like protein
MPKVTKNITIIVLIIIIVSAFVGTSIFNYLNTRASLRKVIISSSLLLLSENVYSEIKKELTLPINISSAMARDFFLIDWVEEGEADPGQIVQYLKKIKSEYGFFTTFFVSDKSNNYYYYDGILKQINPNDDHDGWYYKFKDSNLQYDLDVDTDEASFNNLTIFINYRLEDSEGNFLGVVGIGVNIDDITTNLIDTEKRYGKRIYLIDENGIIQVNTDKIEIEQESILNQKGIMDVAAKLMVKQAEPVDESYVVEQGRILVSSRYIPEMGWFIIIEQKEKTAFAQARGNLILTIAVGFITTILIVFLSSITINRYQTRLELLASTDALTNTANRREFEARFQRAQYRFLRYNTPLSLLIVDIDNFKAINDKKGHLTGDSVLKTLSGKIKELIRPDDLLARWGGDEFVILLQAERKKAVTLAERLRVSIAGNVEKQSQGIENNITVSIGVSTYIKDESLDSIMNRADKALYKSKAAGKNRVTEITA